VEADSAEEAKSKVEADEIFSVQAEPDRMATEAQIRYLVGYGVDGSQFTFDKASAVLTEAEKHGPPDSGERITNRQLMLGRFFFEGENLETFSQLTKQQASNYLDYFFQQCPEAKSLWNRWKAQHNIPEGQPDPSIVPVGSFNRYIEQLKREQDQSKPVGCLKFIVAVAGFLFLAQLCHIRGPDSKIPSG
jgi:hypothetical protein